MFGIGEKKPTQQQLEHRQSGVVRTDMNCTDCSRVFIAKINFDVNGNHIIKCPYCGHDHHRVITNGIVTEARHGSQGGPNTEVPTERMWANTTMGAVTTTAAEYIRQQYLKFNTEGK
jgi:DNA-directed RNA polymerase subunit RPC12/RpoP